MVDGYKSSQTKIDEKHIVYRHNQSTITVTVTRSLQRLLQSFRYWRSNQFNSYVNQQKRKSLLDVHAYI